MTVGNVATLKHASAYNDLQPTGCWRMVMTDALKKLIEATRTLDQSAREKEQQRRSFAYGNTKFENDRITREMVDLQAELLNKNANR
jgi:hypothetical protein